MHPEYVSLQGLDQFLKQTYQGVVMAEFDDAGYGRNYPRENLRTEAEIMIDEQWHDCVIVNMSPSGARLNIVLEVSRGKDVIIKIGAYGRFNATVAWCRDNEIGVKFDHDASEMTRVLIELESRG
jgi:hypothetical protein